MMFGTVLATVYESLIAPADRPMTAPSNSFDTKPVRRLSRVATAIEPLALASDGSSSCCWSTVVVLNSGDALSGGQVSRVVLVATPPAAAAQMINTSTGCQPGGPPWVSTVCR